MLLTLFKVIIFGIVEGITEWLPISSTGHMILLNAWLPLPFNDAFLSVFLIVIQLGAIFAVLCIFWQDIWPFDNSCRNRPMGNKRLSGWQLKTDVVKLWIKIVVACIPAVILELFWGDVLEEKFYRPISVAAALIIVGVLFLAVETVCRRKQPTVVMTEAITWQMAFFIGVCQAAAAAFPGTSRSGATIIGALLLGIARPTAAAFTFYLAIPVMIGASLLKIFSYPTVWTGELIFYMLAGMTAAFLVSMAVIRFLMNYVKRHDFKIFGWYRIILGIFVFVFFYKYS